jgi:hypothetical protein
MGIWQHQVAKVFAAIPAIVKLAIVIQKSQLAM